LTEQDASLPLSQVEADDLQRRTAVAAAAAADRGVECVFLHGSLELLRCFRCGLTVPWEIDDRLQETLAGGQPECPHCVGATVAREERGKRALGVGKLRPDIVLYGEEHPQADLIGPIVRHDLALVPDMMLILGTSLRVHGLKVMVREFARAVHEGRGTAGKVVFVNFTQPSESVWGDVIDYWVQWDCDAWVGDLRTRAPAVWGTAETEVATLGGVPAVGAAAATLSSSTAAAVATVAAPEAPAAPAAPAITSAGEGAATGAGGAKRRRKRPRDEHDEDGSKPEGEAEGAIATAEPAASGKGSIRAGGPAPEASGEHDKPHDGPADGRAAPEGAYTNAFFGLPRGRRRTGAGADGGSEGEARPASADPSHALATVTAAPAEAVVAKPSATKSTAAKLSAAKSTVAKEAKEGGTAAPRTGKRKRADSIAESKIDSGKISATADEKAVSTKSSKTARSANTDKKAKNTAPTAPTAPAVSGTSGASQLLEAAGILQDSPSTANIAGARSRRQKTTAAGRPDCSLLDVLAEQAARQAAADAQKAVAAASVPSVATALPTPVETPSVPTAAASAPSSKKRRTYGPGQKPLPRFLHDMSRIESHAVWRIRMALARIGGRPAPVSRPGEHAVKNRQPGGPWYMVAHTRYHADEPLVEPVLPTLPAREPPSHAAHSSSHQVNSLFECSSGSLRKNAPSNTKRAAPRISARPLSPPPPQPPRADSQYLHHSLPTDPSRALSHALLALSNPHHPLLALSADTVSHAALLSSLANASRTTSSTSNGSDGGSRFSARELDVARFLAEQFSARLSSDKIRETHDRLGTGPGSVGDDDAQTQDDAINDDAAGASFSRSNSILDSVKTNPRVRRRKIIDGVEVALPVSRAATPRASTPGPFAAAAPRSSPGPTDARPPPTRMLRRSYSFGGSPPRPSAPPPTPERGRSLQRALGGEGEVSPTTPRSASMSATLSGFLARSSDVGEKGEREWERRRMELLGSGGAPLLGGDGAGVSAIGDDKRSGAGDKSSPRFAVAVADSASSSNVAMAAPQLRAPARRWVLRDETLEHLHVGRMGRATTPRRVV
jgi:NAD-dependent SIR2 family protein deacetylase